MSAVIQAPLDMIEDVAGLRFPSKTDELLQSLMDRNTDGKLSSGRVESADRISSR
jgi:hypothetical protein